MTAIVRQPETVALYLERLYFSDVILIVYISKI